MRSFAILLLGALLSPLAMSQTPPVSHPAKAGPWDAMHLDWTKPFPETNARGAQTTAGIPVGNNFTGIRIKGGVQTETWQINDKTFWSGTPNNSTDPARRTAMEKCRRDLLAGDIPAANRAAEELWGVRWLSSYLPMGLLHLRMTHGDQPEDYRMRLDLDRSLCTVTYRVEGVNYTRETFASYPGQIVVSQIRADRAGAISGTLAFSYPPEMEGHGASIRASDRTLVMNVRAPYENLTYDATHGIRGEVRVKIVPTGGTVEAVGNQLVVNHADSLVIYLATATDFRGPFTQPGADGDAPSEVNTQRISVASARSFQDLQSAHEADYRALFRRIWAEVNGDPTDIRVLAMQYARYDMIACSRSGDRPRNQQGMWSCEWKPANQCAQFLNENLQKYYGIIETLNLSETGEPLWNYMDALAVNGRESARVDWGFRGWMASHCSDIWATTFLKGGNNAWAIWPLGGAWLCNNLWDHYAFTQDRAFLEKRAYPLLKGACEFALDLLVEGPDGTLAVAPSTSPENSFQYTDGKAYGVTVSSTCDVALIRELFKQTIASAKILGVDAAFEEQLRRTQEKLPAYRINAQGRLQEWAVDYAESEPAHRHASHLLTVWPLTQITERGTPDLYAAAARSLEDRGTGGFHPDKAAMWARLKQPEKAYAGLGKRGGIASTWTGITNAFPEMLLFSHNQATDGTYELELLPALPAEWKSGVVRGLGARGGFEVDLEWSDNHLQSATIRSITGQRCNVRSGDQVISLEVPPGAERVLHPEDFAKSSRSHD